MLSLSRPHGVWYYDSVVLSQPPMLTVPSPSMKSLVHRSLLGSTERTSESILGRSRDTRRGGTLPGVSWVVDHLEDKTTRRGHLQRDLVDQTTTDSMWSTRYNDTHVGGVTFENICDGNIVE